MAVFSNIHPILRRIPVFPVPNRLFNQVGSIGAAVFIAQGLPDARRVARVFRVADECAQALRQILCRQLIARNRFRPAPGSVHPLRPERLIAPKRHDERRQRMAQAGRGRPCAAVMTAPAICGNSQSCGTLFT